MSVVLSLLWGGIAQTIRGFSFLLLLALGADARELQPVVQNLVALHGLCLGHGIWQRRSLHVGRFSAPDAANMGMRRERAVIAGLVAAGVQLPSLPGSAEDLKVAVHGAQADAGHLLTETLVQIIRGGMARHTPKLLQREPSLPCCSQGLNIHNNNYYYQLSKSFQVVT